jgi:hypothetical protein
VENQQQPHMPCQYCSCAVKLNGKGLWIHINGGYECRDAAGVVQKSFAAPVGWPMNPVVQDADVSGGRRRKTAGR